MEDEEEVDEIENFCLKAEITEVAMALEPNEQTTAISYGSVVPRREDVSELKVPFDTVREEISSTLMKGSKHMQATEQLYLAAANMTKTLDKKYTDASNEQKEWKDVKVKLARTLQKDKVVLNVDGIPYTTNIHTLTSINDSYLTELFSGEWKGDLDPTDGSFFIDRNGRAFAHILEYLRTNEVSEDLLQDEILRHNLLIEARFFRLPHLVNILEAAEKAAIEAEKAEIEKQRSFPNSTLLTIEHKKKLYELYGKQDQRWELIYKASRDGFDANAFHTHCNNQGPTMTIVQSNNGYLFGGYTGLAWTSDGTYKNDTTAFVYSH